jgi:hypothetical protein
VPSLQNVRAAHRDELARPKCVESMGNQYSDTENDQNACNNRPHERSPRRHRLGGREPAQSKRISNIGGNCSALMILSNRKGPFPDSVNRCDLPRQAERRCTTRRPNAQGVVPRAVLDVVMGVALASVLLPGKPLRGSRWLARAAFILMISVGRNKLLDVPTFATSAVLP